MERVLSRESMVYGSVCSLTAVMVLAHVLLGCCCHHQHASPHQPACTTCVHHAGADCHGHSCGQEGGRHHWPAGGEHQDRGGCEGGRCVFVTGQPSRTPVAAAAEFCGVVTVVAMVDDGLPAESSVCAGAFAAGKRCASLRTHLWQQVLLL